MRHVLEAFLVLHLKSLDHTASESLAELRLFIAVELQDRWMPVS